jgi:hypothetical protein
LAHVSAESFCARIRIHQPQLPIDPADQASITATPADLL